MAGRMGGTTRKLSKAALGVCGDDMDIIELIGYGMIRAGFFGFFTVCMIAWLRRWKRG